MKKFGILLLIVTILLLVVSCTPQAPPPAPAPAVGASAAEKTEPAPEEEYDIKVTADGTKYIIHPEKIQSGGPPKDGIPSIDNPMFAPLKEADLWIEDNELVLAIIYKGIKRVYPLQIMVWHEIVNDTIAGDPILITYCPLTLYEKRHPRMLSAGG